MKHELSADLRYRLKALWQRWARPLLSCSISVIISIAALSITPTSVGQDLNLRVLRTFFKWRGPRPPPPDVVIVAIGDDSYTALQISPRWPFPRKYSAEALEQLVKSEPKAIIIDSAYPKEEGPMADPESDRRIEAALRSGPTTLWEGKMRFDYGDATASNPAPFVTIPSDPRFRAAAKMELPMLVARRNGMVSDIALDHRDNVTLYERVPLARPLTELAGFNVTAPGPFDLINFYGPRATITRVPIHKLIGEVNESIRETIRGKVVLFGQQSLGRERGTADKDEYNVSVSEDPMFGLEIHANIAGNLIDGSWLRRLPVEAEALILFGGAFALALIGVAVSPLKAIPLVATALAASTWLLNFRFVHGFVWLPAFATFLFASAIGLVVGSAIYVARSEAFRKYIRKMFKFQMDKEI